MEVELMDCERQILAEVGNKKFMRNDIATTYAFCISSSKKPNWGKINRAIIQRWSRSGLCYIKRKAWKLTDVKRRDYWGEEKKRGDNK